MSFIWQDMLWLLILIPVIIAAYVLMQRRRQKYALRYASLSLIKDAMGKGPQIRRHIPPIIFIAGLTILLVSIARPAASLTLPSQQGTVILAIDVSGSMGADDMNPSRLEAAKAAARLFINNEAKKVRIGVVSFSGSAFMTQPPTIDREATIAAIERLQPLQSTAIGSAIEASLGAIFDTTGPVAAAGQPGQPELGTTQPVNTPVPAGSYNAAAIVLLSDGESNTGEDPLKVVQQAVDRGVKVYTVGLGSVEGTVVQVDGRSMRVKLDEEALTTIAERTGGTYSKAGTETDLNKIYDNLGTKLVFDTQKTEITAFFAGAAGLFLLFSMCLSMIWFNRIP